MSQRTRRAQCASIARVNRVAPLHGPIAQSGDEIASNVGVPARLVDRVLIWLLAPAAVETSTYR
jgi:hypothetical protein